MAGHVHLLLDGVERDGLVVHETRNSVVARWAAGLLVDDLGVDGEGAAVDLDAADVMDVRVVEGSSAGASRGGIGSLGCRFMKAAR